jgi:hypothetical protein
MSHGKRAVLAVAALGLLAADGAAQFRFFIPSDIPIQEEEPAAPEAFAKAAAAPESEDFGVKIELELSRGGSAFQVVPLGTPICNGDFVAFRFTPSGAGFASIVNHGTSGSWSRIWPARDYEDPSFGPDEPVRLPGQAGSGFPVSGPPGGEHIMIFFSPGPFSSELQQLQDRLLSSEEAGPGGVAQNITGGGTRALEITHLRDLGSAQAAHVVGQGEQTVAFTLDHREGCPAL